MNDFEQKKAFLYQGALLYDALIRFAPDDTVRRYLAFRIMVDAMSFEDMVGKRAHPRIRKIRDVLLAHKQEPDFFAGYKASDEIRDATISPLLTFMRSQVDPSQQTAVIRELSDPAVSPKFESMVRAIMQKYYADEVAGYRVTNNFLCFPGHHVHEISNNDLAGCFYRYNSSKALAGFAQYFFNNLRGQGEYETITRHAKRDIILHAMNMADSIFKDTRNQHSIEGLYEIMQHEKLGNTSSLAALVSDQGYKTAYSEIREIRNKLVGHMDKSIPLADLLTRLDSFPADDLFKLINSVDFATYNAARSHIAIWARYATSNSRIPEDQQFKVLDIPGLKPTPYF